MTTIQLITIIKAPIETVFNNTRNIDLHQKSASQTNEKAIAGTITGLIEKGETVTWRGKHFGIYLQHQSVISEMEFPIYFTDKQLKGHFKSFEHKHFFKERNGVTLMEDQLCYKMPFGIIGKTFHYLFLKRHLCNFLKYRNEILKYVSEKN